MRRLMLSIPIIALCLDGCATQSRPPVERRGDVVAQGIGQLSFRAPGPGLVSVFDVNDNSIIHTSAVDAGSVVTVNPPAGNITVTDASRAGTQIVHTGVTKSHAYEIWFIPRTYHPADASSTRPLQ